MPTPPDSPVEPRECRRLAEDQLGTPTAEAPVRAAAWALLAIAGELHTIRQHLERKAR